jgi:hypothetical protein
MKMSPKTTDVPVPGPVAVPAPPPEPAPMAAPEPGATPGTTAVPGTPNGADSSAERAKELFEVHVPLSLIMDLNPPDGPHSRDILDAEGTPEDAWWEPR